MSIQYNPANYPVPFLGYQATQTWNDLLLWERFFNTYKVNGVFELGTSGGGLAVFLALQCYHRGAKFATIDNQNWFPARQGVPALLGMPANFHIADLWGAGGDIVREFIQANRPVCLMCDDGDKPREWLTFGPLLRPGDFIAVHDWGVEFKPENVGDLPVKMILQKECEEQNSMTRWFIRS